MAKKINYNARNFQDVRSELIRFVKEYYPSIFNDFNDASVGMMLLELNAAVGDMLSFNTDRMFQETQIDFAQELSSLLSLARTFGLKTPGKRPSVTIVDFSVIVPVKGDTFDLDYTPIIRQGAQIGGAGKIFETVNDIDFSEPFTLGGIPNRLILPNVDSDNQITNYTIVKREMVINGVTKIVKRVITANDVKPFFEYILPDDNVLSVTSVITLEGTNYTTTPSLDQFLDEDLRWYEVDALADDIIFIDDSTGVSDNASIKKGKFKRITQKFLMEYTNNGFARLIFGSGSQDISSLCEFGVDKVLIDRIGDFINNSSLGVAPSSNHTMYIQYRVGGGANSNIGPNVLNSVKTADIVVNGPQTQVNINVRNSLTVNNPIPALGGKDNPSIEELRNLIRYNFSAQNRVVTINDYKARISLMPGKYGVPYRHGVFEEQNKIKVYILGLDANGKLTSQSTSTLKENIALYLSDYRMLNDYVEVTNGKIINLAFEVDLFVDKQYPQSQIIAEAATAVADYLDISKWTMGQNIYLAQLVENLNNVGGVLNIIELRVYNKVGSGLYSSSEIAQPYTDNATRQIDLLGEYTLFGDPISMFEIKYPTQDIRVRVKKSN